MKKRSKQKTLFFIFAYKNSEKTHKILDGVSGECYSVKVKARCMRLSRSHTPLTQPNLEGLSHVEVNLIKVHSSRVLFFLLDLPRL